MRPGDDSDESPRDDPAARPEVAAYLARHNIYSRLNDIVARILEERPMDPRDALLQALEAWSAETTLQPAEDSPSPLAVAVTASGSVGLLEIEPLPRRYTSAFATPQPQQEDSPTRQPSSECDHAEGHSQATSGGLSLPDAVSHRPRRSVGDDSRKSTTSDFEFNLQVDSASSDDEDDAFGMGQSGSSTPRLFQPLDPILDNMDTFEFLQEVLGASLQQMLNNNGGSRSSSSLFVVGGTLSNASGLDLLGFTCASSMELPTRTQDDDAPRTSIKEILFNAAFDVVIGSKDNDVVASILNALDFSLLLQLGHAIVCTAAMPRDVWRSRIIATFAAILCKSGRAIENPTVRRLKFALMHRLVDALSLLDPTRAKAHETVIREVLGYIVDQVLEANLLLAEGEVTLTSEPHPKGDATPTLTQIASSLRSHLLHRFSHVPVVEVAKLVEMLHRVWSSNEQAFEDIIDELLQCGICDSYHVGALAVVAVSALPDTVKPRGPVTIAGADFVDDDASHLHTAKLVVSFTTRVKNTVERRWIEAIEAGEIMFDLKCREAADVLKRADLKQLGNMFPKASPATLETAVNTLVQLAKGDTTLNRTLFALSCVGIFTSQLSRFFSALLRTVPDRPEYACLWLCGVAQNIRGGLRAVFSVKQLVDDDGKVDQHQALFDVKLGKAVVTSGAGGAAAPFSPSSAGPSTGNTSSSGGGGGSSGISGISAGVAAHLRNVAASATVLVNAGTDTSYYDLVPPTRRPLFTPEDQSELLSIQAWDFTALGVHYDRCAFWREQLDKKLRRLASVPLHVEEVLQIASQNLRRAQRIEDRMLQARGIDVSCKSRLPLALRALVCTGDVFVSMLLSCLVTDVPCTLQSPLKTSWREMEVSERQRRISTALGETTGGAYVDRLRLQELAASIHDALDQLVESAGHVSREAVDQYTKATACAGIWSEDLHGWHRVLTCSLTASSPYVVDTWGVFLHHLMLSAMSREENMQKFAPTDLDCLSSLRTWHSAMIKNETAVRLAVAGRTQLIGQKGSPRQAEYLRRHAARIQQAFGQLLDVATAPDPSSHTLRSIAVEDALEGVTYVHHSSIAAVMFQTLWSQDASLLQLPARAAAVVAVYLGRVVSMLTCLCLPRITELDAVARQVRRSGVLSASCSVVGSLRPSSFESRPVTATTSPTIGPGNIPSSVFGNSLRTGMNNLTLPESSQSINASQQGNDWQTALPSLLAAAILRRLSQATNDHQRGWYVSFATEALKRFAKGLVFDDVFHFTGPDFQLSLQQACFSLMTGGMTTSQFQQFAAALQESLGGSATSSVASESQHMLILLQRVGEMVFQFPTEEDRLAVLPLLAEDYRSTEAAIAQYRDLVLRTVAQPLPIVALSILLDHFSAGAYTSYTAVVDEVCRLAYTALVMMVRGVVNLDTVSSNSDVVRFLSVVALLSCGGQPQGLALVGCFGDMVCNLSIRETDALLQGRWARVVLKVASFVENRVHVALTRPTSSTMTVTFKSINEIIDVSGLKKRAERIESYLFPAGYNDRSSPSAAATSQNDVTQTQAPPSTALSSIMYTNKKFAEYLCDVAEEMFAVLQPADLLSHADFDESETTIHLQAAANWVSTAFSWLEGNGTDLLSGGASLVAAIRRSTLRSGSAEQVERWIWCTTGQLMMALDDMDRRCLRDFFVRRKDALPVLQSLENADASGWVSLEPGLPVKMDILMKRCPSQVVTECSRCVSQFITSWHLADFGDRDGTAREETAETELALSNDDAFDAVDERVLPMFYYRKGLVPPQVVDQLAIGGLVPRDTESVYRFLRGVVQESGGSALQAATVAGGSQTHSSARLRSRSISAGSVQSNGLQPIGTSIDPLIASGDALGVIRLFLRTLHNELAHLAMQSFAPRETGAYAQLLQQLSTTQMLVYLNLQKNESSTKSALAAEWQAPYLAPSMLQPANGSKLGLDVATFFKLKEPSEHVVPFHVLQEVFMDVYFPHSVAYARSAVNTTKFAVDEAKRIPHELVLRIFQTYGAQRGTSLAATTYLSAEEWQSLKQVWDRVFSPSPTSPGALELVAKYSGMLLTNVTLALNMLHRVMQRAGSILMQPTLLASMVLFSMELTTEEENLVLQVFGAQWGPMMHSLLIALMAKGDASHRQLRTLVRACRSLRLIARCASTLKKSQPQETHFTRLPHTEIRAFLRQSSLFPTGASLDAAAKHACVLMELVRDLCDSRLSSRSGEPAPSSHTPIGIPGNNVAVLSNSVSTHSSPPSMSVALRQWVEERVLSSFTRAQLGAAIRSANDALQNSYDRFGNVCDAIRWILVVVYLGARHEEEVQQKLQLPACGPPNVASTRCAVLVSAKMRPPAIEGALRTKCLTAMTAVNSGRNLRPVAMLILDYLSDTLEKLHPNMVDAFSRYEGRFRFLIQKTGLLFRELQSMCLVVMQQLLTNTRSSPNFSDAQQLQLAMASLCRGLHTSSFAQAIGSAATGTSPNTATAVDSGSSSASALLGSRSQSLMGTSANLGSSASYESVEEFPHSELKLFSYSWLRLMPDIIEIYNLTLVKYRRQMQERGMKQMIDAEDVRAFLLLLHCIAADANDENKRLSPTLINFVVEQWAANVKNTSRLNRVSFGCLSQSVQEAVDQCDSSVAIRELFSSATLKSAWNKILWFVTTAALTSLTRSQRTSLSSSSPETISPRKQPPFEAGPPSSTPSPPQPPSSNSMPSVRSFKDIPVVSVSTTSGPTFAASSISSSNANNSRVSFPSTPIVEAASSTPTVAQSSPSLPPSSATSAGAAAAVTGLPTGAATRWITMDEVKKHASRRDGWVVIRNRVYDVTSLMLSHPGGMGAILAMAGRDGTVSFTGNHEVGSIAFTKIATYYIGELQT